MALLNRSPEWDRLYDAHGRLQGGLSSLEELAKAISINSGKDRGQEAMDDEEDEIEPAKELPVHDPTLSLDSDEDMIPDEEPGSSDDEVMEEITMYEAKASPSSSLAVPLTSSPAALSPTGSPTSLRSPVLGRKNSTDSLGSTSTSKARSRKSSKQSLRRGTTTDSTKNFIPIGERLKQRFLELNVLSTLLVCVVHFSVKDPPHGFNRICSSSSHGTISFTALFTILFTRY